MGACRQEIAGNFIGALKGLGAQQNMYGNGKLRADLQCDPPGAPAPRRQTGAQAAYF
jgi:hypothetical protein